MRKTIGNVLLIIGLVSLAFLICNFYFEWVMEDGFFVVLYVVGLLGGGALRIGDFFKWRAKKYHEGIMEAQQTSGQATNGFCPHCGKGLTSKTAFCPHCGKALN